MHGSMPFVSCANRQEQPVSIEPDGRLCLLMCTCNSVLLFRRFHGGPLPPPSWERTMRLSPLFCRVGVHLAGGTTSIVSTRTHP